MRECSVRNEYKSAGEGVWDKGWGCGRDREEQNK